MIRCQTPAFAVETIDMDPVETYLRELRDIHSTWTISRASSNGVSSVSTAGAAEEPPAQQPAR